jgi:AcrR family transcriptional regulator
MAVDTARRGVRRKRGGTRNNMLVSAAEVMRERGAAGVTIDEVLARSGAPRGSVYYHFPEGRNQILTEALRYAGDPSPPPSMTRLTRAPRSCCGALSSIGNTCWPTATSTPAARW